MPNIKIAHFSDIHGHLSILKDKIPDDVDLIISTGDIFPNLTRGIVDVEERFQLRWFDDNYPEIKSLLKGKPIICVQGNHDFVCLASLLRKEGHLAKKVISGMPVDMFGIRFAGFPGIPYIQGEWWGEFDQDYFLKFVKEAIDLAPDVLLTHAPPDGILHSPRYSGIRALTNAINYGEFEPEYHLYGHSHEGFGQATIEGTKTKFINGACHCLVHQIEIPAKA